MPQYLEKEVVVLGCGNWLFGDDGFGVEAVRYLARTATPPPHVAFIEAGLSVRNILFDIALSEKKPEKVIIIDAVDAGREPGEVFEISIDEIPLKKIDDFSMHQMPTTNLLKELKERCHVDVRIVAVQVENIPESVKPGISEKLLRSLPLVEKVVTNLIGGKNARVENSRGNS